MLLWPLLAAEQRSVWITPRGCRGGSISAREQPKRSKSSGAGIGGASIGDERLDDNTNHSISKTF